MERSMKYFCFILLITCTYGLPSGDINQEAFNKAEVECQNELNITDETIQTKTEEELSRISSCAMLCVGNKIGYITGNGSFNIDKTLVLAKSLERQSNDTIIDPQILKTILEYCNKNHEVLKDKCLTTGNLFICLTEQFNEYGILQ